MKQKAYTYVFKITHKMNTIFMVLSKVMFSNVKMHIFKTDTTFLHFFKKEFCNIRYGAWRVLQNTLRVKSETTLLAFQM